MYLSIYCRLSELWHQIVINGSQTRPLLVKSVVLLSDSTAGAVRALQSAALLIQAAASEDDAVAEDVASAVASALIVGNGTAMMRKRSVEQDVAMTFAPVDTRVTPAYAFIGRTFDSLVSV